MDNFNRGQVKNKQKCWAWYKRLLLAQVQHLHLLLTESHPFLYLQYQSKHLMHLYLYLFFKNQKGSRVNLHVVNMAICCMEACKIAAFHLS